MVKGNWALFEEDFYSISLILQTLMRSAGSRSVMLIDKTGQLINSIGEPPGFDVTSFSSLAAADFAANAQLAEMVGEKDFATLVHQGTNESLYLSLIANRVILVVLFDNRTTLGLVRLKMKQTVEELTKLFEQVFNRPPQSQGGAPGLLAGADDEIDKLFQ